jgi:hypothetical protein
MSWLACLDPGLILANYRCLFAQALGFVTPKHLDIHATGNIDVALEAAGNGMSRTASLPNFGYQPMLAAPRYPTWPRATDHALSFCLAELQAMNKYRAPRAKLVCLVNCCKIIFSMRFVVLIYRAL